MVVLDGGIHHFPPPTLIYLSISELKQATAVHFTMRTFKCLESAQHNTRRGVFSVIHFVYLNFEVH